MGAIKTDLEKQARAYEVKYALNDSAGVKALLRDRHRISSARFTGDYAASDILLDLNSAIYNAGLTERQTEAVAWVYGADITQVKAAELMGVTQQTIAQSLEETAGKIAEVYKRWEYGEVTVNFEEYNESEAAE